MATSIRTARIARVSLTIPAGQTVDIETRTFTSFSSTKYLIEYKSEANSVFKALEMLGSKKTNDVSDTIHSKIGNNIDVETNLLKDGSDVVLRATNNEAFDLVASVSRQLI